MKHLNPSVWIAAALAAVTLVLAGLGTGLLVSRDRAAASAPAADSAASAPAAGESAEGPALSAAISLAV
ncbi:MAG: hypothetical protein IJL69_03785, partial [Oscillospiraceae bacterium]|nr:hypothetical protein [Oscillospiraceae bacterium]